VGGAEAMGERSRAHAARPMATTATARAIKVGQLRRSHDTESRADETARWGSTSCVGSDTADCSGSASSVGSDTADCAGSASSVGSDTADCAGLASSVGSDTAETVVQAGVGPGNSAHPRGLPIKLMICLPNQNGMPDAFADFLPIGDASTGHPARGAVRQSAQAKRSDDVPKQP
jgi:hypothetical protein